jgi:hypothetical protein
MSGYIMNLSSRASLEMYIRNGAYGTIIRRPERGFWSTANEMTMADYLTMRSGDLIFFFLERQVYGVGRLVSFPCRDGEAVALCNFPGSSEPTSQPPADLLNYLWRENGEENIRWVVFFKPSPCFFTHGLDMDEVLEADNKGVVRSLRAFEKRSFVQIDDEEAQVILDLLVRRHEKVLDDLSAHSGTVFPDESGPVHAKVAGTDLTAHALDVDPLLRRHTSEGLIRHEALIQAWLVGKLVGRAPAVTGILGEWDFVANQVPASPQKPVCYMDRIDVFGHVTRRLSSDLPATVVRYKIVEIKKDFIESIEAIDQLMKYVDWTAHTRSGGDYAMIDAYLVAHGFSEEVVAYAREGTSRRYVVPRRPYRTQDWSRLRLVSYDYLGSPPGMSLTPA